MLEIALKVGCYIPVKGILSIPTILKLNKSVTLALVCLSVVSYCNVASPSAPLKVVRNITLTEMERQIAYK